MAPVCQGCRVRARAITIWEKPATGLCPACARAWLRSPEKEKILADMAAAVTEDGDIGAINPGTDYPERLVDLFLARMYRENRWWNRFLRWAGRFLR